MLRMAKSSAGRSSWTRNRWAIAGVAAVVIAVAFVGYALTAHFTRGDTAAATGPAYTPPPVAQTASFTMPADPRALFFGDSYTAGEGATSPEMAYPAVASRVLGWDHRTVAVGGTGYVNPGDQNSGNYSTRIPGLREQLADFVPNIVVMQGSLNDQGVPVNELTEQAGSDIDAMRATYPDAQIVVLGPSAPTVPSRPAINKVTNILYNVALDKGVVWINALSWMLQAGPGYLAPDSVHPSDFGHQKIAERFIETVTEQSPQ
jgi:acyl-CoA thioesterase-1